MRTVGDYCGTCRWWDTDDQKTGQCRVAPPQFPTPAIGLDLLPVDNSAIYAGIWPTTDQYDFCREFEEWTAWELKTMGVAT